MTALPAKNAPLGPDSRILSAGAGNDISFEKALTERYGCRVVLLDPSPTGVATVERENLPADKLIFMPVGLADSYASMRLEVASAYTLIFFIMIVPLLVAMQMIGRRSSKTGLLL